MQGALRLYMLQMKGKALNEHYVYHTRVFMKKQVDLSSSADEQRLAISQLVNEHNRMKNPPPANPNATKLSAQGTVQEDISEGLTAKESHERLSRQFAEYILLITDMRVWLLKTSNNSKEWAMRLADEREDVAGDPRSPSESAALLHRALVAGGGARRSSAMGLFTGIGKMAARGVTGVGRGIGKAMQATHRVMEGKAKASSGNAHQEGARVVCGTRLPLVLQRSATVPLALSFLVLLLVMGADPGALHDS